MSKLRFALFAGAVVGTLGFTAAARAAPDAAAGKAIWARCSICHTLMPGQNRLGPSLAGVFGRKAGTVSGFNYSSAMKSAGIVWNAKALDAYLLKPSALVPGNKMVFAGLANPTDRANLIAYMKTGGK